MRVLPRSVQLRRLCLSLALAALALGPPPARAAISFAEPRLLPAAFGDPIGSFFGAVAADLDGDGKLDLAATGQGVVGLLTTSSQREFVAIWLGNGDGTFQAPVYVDLGAPDSVGAAGLVAVDLDHDGVLDLAVAAWRLRAVLVLRGRGDGTFADPVQLDAGIQAGSLQAADLDGDGDADLAIAPAPVDASVNRIAVLRGDGIGGFGAPTLHATATFPVDLVLADVDGQHGLDILVACNTDQLSVLLNDGHAGFPATAASYPVRIDSRGLWAGDFDGDGKVDVLVAGLGGTYGDTCGMGCIVTVHGNGDGTFTAPPVENVRITGAWPSRFYVAGSLGPDLNGDGRPDAFFARPEGNLVINQVTVVLSQPGGGWALQEWVASPGLAAVPDARQDGSGAVAAAAGDFDGDGAVDLVVTSAAGYGGGVGAVTFLPGDPTHHGTFRAPRIFSTQGGWSSTRGLAIGALDAGGTLDLLTIGDALDTLPGLGDGTFGSPLAGLGRVAGPGEFYQTLRTADLNGDGKLDALWLATDGVQGGPPPRHLLAFGNGDGTFGAVQALSPEGGFMGVNAAIADLDGLGGRDLVILTASGAVVHAESWTNDGQATPTFTLRDVVAVQPGAVLAASPGMAVADLDADGHPDLVAHRFNAAGGDDLLFFKGVGDGTFAAARVIASDLGATVNDVAVGDLDGDGKPDLVLAQGSFATVLLGNGNGTFRRPTTGSDVVSGVGTYQVQLADLDGDGRLDLVVGAGNGPAFHRGDGLGGFGPPRHLAIGVEAGGYPFALADLDGDGLPDLVAGHGNFEPGLGPAHDYLTVLRNDSGPRADLAVALAGAPAPVHVAEPLDWTVTVANHGPDAATGVTVRQPLRHGASFGSAGASQGSCTRAGDVVTCSLGTVAANASATTTVRVVPTAAGTLWHTASARSALADPGGGDDGDSARVTVLSASADLGLTASAAPDPVTVGGSLTYTFTATNHGPSAATGVTFTDALPAAATFLSAATTAGTCAHLAGTVTCAVGTLPASGQARITIAVSPQAAGALGNQGTVSGVEADPAAANNAGSAQVTVEAASAGGSGGGGCGCTAAGDPVGLTLLGLALLLRRRR